MVAFAVGMLDAHEVDWSGPGMAAALVARRLPEPPPGELLLAHTAVLLAPPRGGSCESRANAPAALLATSGVGRVLAVGDGVPASLVGARLAYAAGVPAAAPASHRLLPAWRCVPVPDELADADVAALLPPGLAAEMLCRRVFKVADGHRVLVRGAAGAVGGALAAWTRQLGALVLGVVRSDDGVAFARQNGCHQVFVDGQDVVAEAVAATTQQRGVDVVFDGVGGDAAALVLACLRRRGHWLAFGASASPRPPLAMAALQRGSWQVAAPQLEDYVRTRDELLRAASAVFTAMRGGVLRARIAAGIPFAEVPEALARALANGARGSCVLLA